MCRITQIIIIRFFIHLPWSKKLLTSHHTEPSIKQVLGTLTIRSRTRSYNNSGIHLQDNKHRHYSIWKHCEYPRKVLIDTKIFLKPQWRKCFITALSLNSMSFRKSSITKCSCCLHHISLVLQNHAVKKRGFQSEAYVHLLKQGTARQQQSRWGYQCKGENQQHRMKRWFTSIQKGCLLLSALFCLYTNFMGIYASFS